MSRLEVAEVPAASAAEPREAPLGAGTIRYRDTGSGRPLLFVHGFMVDGTVWAKVVAELERDYRCIVPDLPMGAHRSAMNPGADLSPPAIAALLEEFAAELELGPVTLIGNDTGGAICQLHAARYPERLEGLILTPSDAYENFFPWIWRYLQAAARVPGGLTVLSKLMSSSFMLRSPLAYGWLTKQPLDSASLERWSTPVLRDSNVRRDTARFLRGISRRQTVDAARRLRDLEAPALIVWVPDDRLFPIRYGVQLLRDLPGAQLALVDDSRVLMPYEQPQALAELIREFLQR